MKTLPLPTLDELLSVLGDFDEARYLLERAQLFNRLAETVKSRDRLALAEASANTLKSAITAFDRALTALAGRGGGANRNETKRGIYREPVSLGAQSKSGPKKSGLPFLTGSL